VDQQQLELSYKAEEERQCGIVWSEQEHQPDPLGI